MSDDEGRGATPPRKRRKVHNPLPPKPPQPPQTMADPSPSPQLQSQLPSEPVRFPIQPLNRFHGASATIKRPREIAHFSYDDQHEYKGDESGISYYHPPALGTDLREGFDTFRHFEEKEDPHLDSLLKTLVSKEKQTGEKVQADFVTWRGMMTKIMTAPFDYFAEFNMFATLHDGTIYLEEDFQAKAADRAAEPTNNRPQNPHMPSHKMMTYWGYKFETVSMLSDTPSQTPQAVIDNRTKAVVSNHAQHCSIVRTVIGPNSLILGGEVDGLSHPKPSNSDAPIPWVELKTAEELPRNPQHRDVLKYERKLLKFWAQSFLLGVEKVIVGFRSKQGILRAIDTYDTAKIPGMVRRGTACWDGNVCINFTASFLEHLKRTITEEGVYKITLQKRGGIIEVVKIRDKGTGGIVSQEFLDWRAREGKAVEPDSKDSVGRDKESGVHVKDSAETGQTNTLGVS